MPTWAFLAGMKIGEKMQVNLGKGKMLNIAFKSVGELNTTDGTREVFFEFNGQPRSVFVRETKSAAAKNIKVREQANKADPNQVCLCSLYTFFHQRLLAIFFILPVY